MTSPRPTSLLDLLPTVYRVRDEERGGPLRDLLAVIAEQVDVVRDDLEALYDDWFIETCRDWVVPYIGELVGYRPGAQAVDAGPDATPEWRLRSRFLTPRRDVANSLAHRRRKGRLALLEVLAADVAGWPARAVEEYRRLAVTQHVNHRRLARGRTVDLRRGDALDRLDGAFDDLAHLVAAGRIASGHTRRRPNIPNVGLFVWRLEPFARTAVPARNVDRAKNRFTFDVLGVDQPLMTWPVDEPDATHLADELNVPAFIRRRALDANTGDYYGPGRSLCVFRPSDAGGRASLEPISSDQVVTADLTGWRYRPRRGQMAVDPVLGRISFHPRETVARGIWVTYRYGTPAALGGGEYLRTVRPVAGRRRYAVGREGTYATIGDAYRAWQADRADLAQRDAVIEITDNEEYVEAVPITLRPGDRLEIRAAQERWPLVRLLDLHANRSDSWEIEGADAEAGADGEPGGPGDGGSRPSGGATADGPAASGGATASGGVTASGPAADGACDECPPLDVAESPDGAPRLVLDGLMIAGRSVHLSGRIGMVVIRHCTLVPGWWLDADCCPTDGEEPSLTIDDLCGGVAIEHSIVGTILVGRDEVRDDPMPIAISDSVVDATEAGLDALAAPDAGFAHVSLTMRRSTVLGRVRVHRVELVEDSIVADHLAVRRRQAGCVRFSFVPDGSRTPRRFACQPDAALARIDEAVARGELPGTSRDDERALAVLRVRPRFDSRRYRTPAYARLGELCPVEISAGASDGSEMGAYHDLFLPLREANLRARLEESIPAGSDAAIVFVT